MKIKKWICRTFGHKTLGGGVLGELQSSGVEVVIDRGSKRYIVYETFIRPRRLHCTRCKESYLGINADYHRKLAVHDFPDGHASLIRQYNPSWNYMVCPVHLKPFVKFDTYFPYHHERSECVDCEK